MVAFRQYLTGTYSEGYFSGAGASSGVPWKWDVAVNGVPFLIDTKALAEFRHRSTPLLRAQQDSSTEPGSGSVNPEALWNRTKTTWHLGAGQRKGDATLGTFQSLYHQGNPFRFSTSKGIDVWTEGQISLLKDTHQARSSSNTNLRLMPAGSRLYLVDGTGLLYTTDGTPSPATWTTVTGTTGVAITSIASDGYTVWVTDGANVYSTNTGTGAAGAYSTVDIDVLGYAKGRLMGSKNNILYYDVAGTLTALFTHANTQFQWVGFAEGPAAIYTAGYAGDKSLIYRIGLRPDATGLDQPIVAGELPDGEIVRAIGSYLGLIFIGTDKGWRLGIPDTQGNLQIGANVATPAAVRCFEGQDRFVWFGYTNYDSTSTGLGRADYSVFGDIDKRQLAYASDLMTTAQGNVLDVVTFGSKRYYAVSANGIWGESTNLVASGTIEDGILDFGIADEKIALQVTANFGPSFVGSYAPGLAIDGSSTFTSLGTTSTAGSTVINYVAGERRATRYEIQNVLSRSGTDATSGPVVTMVTLRLQPAPVMNPKIYAPLLIFEQQTVDGVDVYMNPAEVVATLKNLNSTRELFVYQEGPDSYSVELDDYEWRPEKVCVDRDHGWSGTFVAVMKEL